MRLALAILSTLFFVILASFGQQVRQTHREGEFVGPNPYHDITQYGGRAVDGPITSRATINLSSPRTASLNSAPALQNGDGVRISGGGATNTLPSPAAPKVTPIQAAGAYGIHKTVNSPAGGDFTFCYEIVARDRNGGLTAAGASGCTKAGFALGPQSAAVRSLSRSGNTVTAVTSDQSFARGAVVWDTQSSDASFSGFYVVASATRTGFSYTQGTSTVHGASTSATGGTAHVFYGNKVTWNVVPRAYQYYVYKYNGTSYALAGVTRVPVGGDPAETEWDDFGQPAPSLPDFVPTTAPASATNDYLATIVVSGGGTNSLTIAKAATNAVSGALIEFDDGPALVACEAAAGNGGTCHIPTNTTAASFIVNSHVSLSQSVGNSILQSGPVILNETIEFSTGDTHWDGGFAAFHNAPQFAWKPGAPLSIGTAYPGISLQGSQSRIENVSILENSEGLGIQVNEGFETTYENINCQVGGSNDVSGTCIWGFGTSNQKIKFGSFISGGPPVAGRGLGALVVLTPDPKGSLPTTASTNCDVCFFTTRGMAIDSGGGPVFLKDIYAQQLATPAFMLTNGMLFDLNGFINDTSAVPIVSAWYPINVSLRIDNVVSDASEGPGGVPPFISGYEVRDLELGLYSGVPGQTLQAEIHPVNSAPSNQTLIAPGMTTSGHLNQLFSGNIGGTCKMSSGTKCTVHLAAPFKGTAICIAELQGTGPVIAAECSITGTSATVTAASSNSDTWGVFFFGNLN